MYTCDICGLERDPRTRMPAPIVLPGSIGRGFISEDAHYPGSQYGVACSEACIRAFKRGETRAPHPFVADDWYSEPVPEPDHTAEAIAYFESQNYGIITGDRERQGLANILTASQRDYNHHQAHLRAHRQLLSTVPIKARYRPWYVWAWRAFKRDVRRAWYR